MFSLRLLTVAVAAFCSASTVVAAPLGNYAVGNKAISRRQTAFKLLE